MNRKINRFEITILALLLSSIAGSAFAASPAPAAAAAGVGINLPLIGRLVGGGNTLYVTSVDIANNTPHPVQVDFYFDATSLATQQRIAVDGSITNLGLSGQGSGTLRGHTNIHFSDFIDALVQAGSITPQLRDEGMQGSLLVVFNGFSRRGQGAASARFWNSFAGGTVGVSLTGREITGNEPRELVATVRDTRGRPGAQLYTNLFINNVGLTPAGSPTTESVSVELTARRNSDGQPVGTTVRIDGLGSGQTRALSNLLSQMQVPSTEDTILVLARVVAGEAAIAGLTSIVDETTRDGSVVEMSRADF
jgi:hypothetical protein